MGAKARATHINTVWGCFYRAESPTLLYKWNSVTYEWELSQWKLEDFYDWELEELSPPTNP
jgi:hypothetical protein